MSKPARAIPGQGIATRLFARVATRLAVGTSPGFFARFGLEDPWATPFQVAPEAEDDPFVFLSASPYYAAMARMRSARARLMARFSENRGLAERKVPGFARRGQVSARVPVLASALSTDPIYIGPEAFAALDPQEGEKAGEYVSRRERARREKKASGATSVASSALDVTTVSARRVARTVMEIEAAEPVVMVRRRSSLSRAIRRVVEETDPVSAVLANVGARRSPIQRAVVARASDDVASQPIAEQVRRARRAVRDVRGPWRRVAEAELEVAAEAERSPVRAARSRADVGTSVGPRRSLRPMMSTSPAFVALAFEAPEVVATETPRGARARRAAVAVAPRRVEVVETPVAREARARRIPARAGPTPSVDEVVEAPLAVVAPRPMLRVAERAAGSANASQRTDARRGFDAVSSAPVSRRAVAERAVAREQAGVADNADVQLAPAATGYVKRVSRRGTVRAAIAPMDRTILAAPLGVEADTAPERPARARVAAPERVRAQKSAPVAVTVERAARDARAVSSAVAPRPVAERDEVVAAPAARRARRIAPTARAAERGVVESSPVALVAASPVRQLRAASPVAPVAFEPAEAVAPAVAAVRRSSSVARAVARAVPVERVDLAGRMTAVPSPTDYVRSEVAAVAADRPQSKRIETARSPVTARKFVPVRDVPRIEQFALPERAQEVVEAAPTVRAPRAAAPVATRAARRAVEAETAVSTPAERVARRAPAAPVAAEVEAEAPVLAAVAAPRARRVTPSRAAAWRGERVERASSVAASPAAYLASAEEPLPTSAVLPSRRAVRRVQAATGQVEWTAEAPVATPSVGSPVERLASRADVPVVADERGRTLVSAESSPSVPSRKVRASRAVTTAAMTTVDPTSSDAPESAPVAGRRERSAAPASTPAARIAARADVPAVPAEARRSISAEAAPVVPTSRVRPSRAVSTDRMVTASPLLSEVAEAAPVARRPRQRVAPTVRATARVVEMAAPTPSLPAPRVVRAASPVAPSTRSVVAREAAAAPASRRPVARPSLSVAPERLEFEAPVLRDAGAVARAVLRADGAAPEAPEARERIGRSPVSHIAPEVRTRALRVGALAAPQVILAAPAPSEAPPTTAAPRRDRAASPVSAPVRRERPARVVAPVAARAVAAEAPVAPEDRWLRASVRAMARPALSPILTEIARRSLPVAPAAPELRLSAEPVATEGPVARRLRARAAAVAPRAVVEEVQVGARIDARPVRARSFPSAPAMSLPAAVAEETPVATPVSRSVRRAVARISAIAQAVARNESAPTVSAGPGRALRSAATTAVIEQVREAVRRREGTPVELARATRWLSDVERAVVAPMRAIEVDDAPMAVPELRVRASRMVAPNAEVVRGVDEPEAAAAPAQRRGVARAESRLAVGSAMSPVARSMSRVFEATRSTRRSRRWDAPASRPMRQAVGTDDLGVYVSVPVTEQPAGPFGLGPAAMPRRGDKVRLQVAGDLVLPRFEDDTVVTANPAAAPRGRSFAPTLGATLARPAAEDTTDAPVASARRRGGRRELPSTLGYLARGDEEMPEVPRGQIVRRRRAPTAEGTLAGFPDTQAPTWAARAVTGAALEAPAWSPEAPRKVSGGNILTALARADRPEDVVQVILERASAIGSLASALPAPAIRMVERIARLGNETMQTANTLSDMEVADTVASQNLRGNQRSTERVRTRTIRTVQRAPSGYVSKQSGSSGQLTKLAEKLMGLIHLAEVDRRKSDAQRQVRMAEEGSAPSGSAPGGGSSNSGENVNIKALQSDVLSAVLREIERMQLRRQEDPDGKSIWW